MGVEESTLGRNSLPLLTLFLSPIHTPALETEISRHLLLQRIIHFLVGERHNSSQSWAPRGLVDGRVETSPAAPGLPPSQGGSSSLNELNQQGKGRDGDGGEAGVTGRKVPSLSRRQLRLLRALLANPQVGLRGSTGWWRSKLRLIYLQLRVQNTHLNAAVSL